MTYSSLLTLNTPIDHHKHEKPWHAFLFSFPIILIHHSYQEKSNFRRFRKFPKIETFLKFCVFWLFDNVHDLSADYRRHLQCLGLRQRHRNRLTPSSCGPRDNSSRLVGSLPAIQSLTICSWGFFCSLFRIFFLASSFLHFGITV